MSPPESALDESASTLSANLRATLITALAIPLSMLLAAIGMRQAGVTGNLMSLGTIDSGLVIDGFGEDRWYGGADGTRAYNLRPQPLGNAGIRRAEARIPLYAAPRAPRKEDYCGYTGDTIWFAV